MRYRILCVTVFAVILGLSCAPYKLLKPKPELSPAEQGYSQIKDEKKDFELKKDKKYSITFPAPQDDHFYVVISFGAKKKVNSFLTATFEKQTTYGAKIADESAQSDTMSVYAIDNKSPAFYWLIENGPQDVVLSMKYRYVPQWRFKFENKYAEYKETFARNVVDRSVYTGIGSTAKLDGFNFQAAIDSVTKHRDALDNVHKELLAIESIFPAKIANSQDPAYLNYKDIKAKVEDEIAFQNSYLTALGFFKLEKSTMGSPADFLAKLAEFSAYFDKKSVLAPNVIIESQRIMKNRLDEVVPFLGMRISGKEDIVPFDTALYFTTAYTKLKTVYEKADIVAPPDLALMSKFVADFDTRTKSLSALKDTLDHIGRDAKNCPQMPTDDFFRGIVSRMTALQSVIPAKIDDQYGKFQNSKCSQELNNAIAKLTTDVTQHLSESKQAEMLVQQLNMLKQQNDLAGMETLLSQSKQAGLIVDKYKDLDRMFLDQQARGIKAALAASSWQPAEAGLKKLHAEQNFQNLQAILPIKTTVVRDLEDSLYSTIERVTRARVGKFCEDKVGVVDNVDSLYTDSVFMPVYKVTFASGGRNELAAKQNTLIADLAKIKDYEFPAKAIKLCYEQFMKSFDDNGVLKARAIVTHGQHYKGDDKDIKLRIIECDPLSPKWITKAKEYRRIFALPVTNNPKGKNKYFVRLDVNIPTDATFPVYDVNIKLPKDVAQNAATSQWYDEISLNKKQLKNEGRFSITAPSASNEYECQITPVQMNKDHANVLEITFTHNSFRPFVVSVMVQKPIIKKN